ncbi:uncharacterized protein [Choristoneura fumiferana]|uniref:uncharacterized protein n=1 Tax=Choristoneura fumiferana TaxID=7141 RepID=UPI003D156603
MLNYLAICVLVIFYSNAEESHNIFVRGSTDYKVQFSLRDDDIEMVSENELIPFHIDDKIYKFHELNKICKKEYFRTIRARSLVHRYYKQNQQPNVIKLIRHNRKITTRSQIPFSKHWQHRRQVDIEKEEEYDYDALINEYYAEAIREEMSNETYHVVKIDSNGTGLMQRLKSIATFNIKLEKLNHRQARQVIAKRIWNISQIWLLIYVVVAIPIWCTLGWCCCCLYCKCFKAHETINNARIYLRLNPPGVLRDKSGDIVYEPSDKEKETYEELDHLIKTL